MKISIVTATYNSAATLRSTLDSILAQTYQDYELLLQDGGSTDDTLAIVEEYAPRFGDRLKLECNPDKGIYDGLNRGCQRATGDVIGTLNSDDFYSSDEVLATIARTYREHPDIEAVYADVHYVRPDDLTRTVRYYSSRKFRPWRIKMGYMPAHPTFYVRRWCYEKYGYYDLDLKVASDFEFVMRLVYIHHIRTRYVHEDWVTMRTGGASTSGLQSYALILSDHRKAFRKHGITFNPLIYSLRYLGKLTEFRLRR